LKILSNFFRYHFPTILWALIIMLSMSIPVKYVPKVAVIGFDKMAHVGIFMIFGLLVFRSVVNFRKHTKKSISSFVLMLIMVMIFGGLSELYQGLIPDRTPDTIDFMADTAGGLIAIMVVLFYNYYKNQTRKQTDSV
jgi:VanZ family protein